MPGKASSSKTRSPPPPAARFIVCRTAQGYWIASTMDGRITGAFPVPPEIARFALRHRQPSHAPGTMRIPRASRARRS